MSAVEEQQQQRAGAAAMDESEDEVIITTDQLVGSAAAVPASAAAPAEETDKPNFAPLSAKEAAGGRRYEIRRVRVPPHRMTPLKRDWLKIYTPIVEHLKMQIRMNPKARMLEVRTCEETEDMGSVQKAADFLRAYCLGFTPEDALALLRMEDLFLDSFEIKDVKTLNGDHLSRAIGRLAGKDGKTKYTIENATKTRIVLADSKIHVMGTFQNIKIAKNAISSLIMGSPPGKIYAHLKIVAARMKGRF
ncbi:pre-rRNA-processing protein pno1 [Coemansia javaensis]|uniref:Pre-rRNA-processing protein PNO1 n=1 Tax=Coemansia javaensis TaxID=2761396 RepID=A0A9W8LLQ2_9FUNG|nr:pre-rRNA-processing protein pno1 [Coemansia javaensis]